MTRSFPATKVPRNAVALPQHLLVAFAQGPLGSRAATPASTKLVAVPQRSSMRTPLSQAKNQEPLPATVRCDPCSRSVPLLRRSCVLPESACFFPQPVSLLFPPRSVSGERAFCKKQKDSAIYMILLVLAICGRNFEPRNLPTQASVPAASSPTSL